MSNRAVFLFLATLGVATPLRSQEPLPQARFAMRNMEINLYADTASGLHFVVGTTETGVEAGAERRLIWLRLDPDSVLDWLNRAMGAIRVPGSGGPSDAIQWSPTLRPVGGVGGLLIGHHLKKGKFEKEHYLAIADSAPGWQAEISAQQADSLLRLVFALAAQARLAAPGTAPFEASRVDRAARVVEQGKPRSRGVAALVAVQYVVGVDGRVEPGSLLVLGAASAELETEAKDLVSGSRFEPAEKAGKPVRQLFRQVIVWR
jgi:hypothetical protein